MENSVNKIIKLALEEDIEKKGDITSDSIFSANHKSKFKLILKENAVISGAEIFSKVFNAVDKSLTVNLKMRDGRYAKKNSVIAIVRGKTVSILRAERTAINFISHMSGIATLTNELTGLIRKTKAILLDTRKTTPGLRFLEKYAVVCGGGKNHRMNLSDAILIKDNHIAQAGGIQSAIQKIRKRLSKKIKIEVEVEDISQLKEAVGLNPDVIMFDNWSSKDLKKALVLVPGKIKTEASGQINLKNIKSYADTGVNYISTSYMFKNSKWVDFSLEADN